MFQLDNDVYNKASAQKLSERLGAQNIAQSQQSMAATQQTMQANDQKMMLERANRYLGMATPENWGAIRQKAISEGLADDAEIPMQYDQNWVAMTRRTLGAEGDSLPAAIREYQYYNSLPQQERESFLNVKRANQIVNLGGTQAVVNPQGNITQQYQVTPKESETPEFEANVAGARKSAELAVEQKGVSDKRSSQANDVMSLAQQAEQYLDAGSGGLGNRIALGAKQMVGMSDQNTQSAAQLQVIGNRLVAAMPRMEGPQSNYDVQLYKDMAGRVADPSVPANDKRAALKSLIDLNSKYTGGNNAQTMPASPQGGAISYQDYFK